MSLYRCGILLGDCKNWTLLNSENTLFSWCVWNRNVIRLDHAKLKGLFQHMCSIFWLSCSLASSCRGLCLPLIHSPYPTILYTDSEGPDQTARRRRLIWAFAVSIWRSSSFPWRSPITTILKDTFQGYELNNSLSCICDSGRWNKKTCEYRTYLKYSDRQAWANSVDPGQTPQNAASDLGLPVCHSYSNLCTITGK